VRLHHSLEHPAEQFRVDAIADVTAIQCHLEGVDQQLEQRAPRRSRQGPVALPVDRMGLEQPTIEERYRAERAGPAGAPVLGAVQDRKSTRLNSSHVKFSYAV